MGFLGMVLAYYPVMGFKRTVILADDLTGANDTAIQFVNHGLSALVLTRAGNCVPPSFDDYEVLALNSDSRTMRAQEAYKTVRDLAARFRPLIKDGRLYKKIDSVLRGNPASELAAVMDELDITLALAAPSFPANQSILEQGQLNSGSERIDAVEVFAHEMNYTVEGIVLEEIHRGCVSLARHILDRHAGGVQVFVSDAVTNDDLEILYRSSSLLGKPAVLAGSAALARHMAGDLSRGGGVFYEEAADMNGKGPVLIIAGTRQGETAAQITTLSRIYSAPIIRFKVDLVNQGKSGQAVNRAFNEAAEQMETSPALCIVAVESMFRSEIPAGNVARFEDGGGALGAAISAALGSLAGKLLEAFDFPVMVSTGGDTTLAVCKSLDVEGIEPLAELCPGIPIGRIAGGPHKGRRIVTKSGRVGNRESLLEIQRFLSPEWAGKRGVNI
jgi:uncharacterized protein YgbK (DUF1537 family)